MDTLPDDLDLCRYPSREIVQGYIQADEISEIRLRKHKDKHRFAVKIGKGLMRQEAEFMLSPQSFQRLWPLTQGRRLQKVRYDIKHADLVWEVDVYQKEMAGLKVVEIEFASEEEADAFVVPVWFGREVTRDERYKNKNLALSGTPEE